MEDFKIAAEFFNGAVKLIHSRTIRDERGTFSLEYNRDEFRQMGLPDFVREFRTLSKTGVIRGLHYQLDPPMGKLMSVVKGSAFMVAVDIRPSSPTFLKHHAVFLDDINVSVWAPAGFARGYQALSSGTVVSYKCDANFNPDEDKSVRWDTAGIEWPLDNPILSRRDYAAPEAWTLGWTRS
jgi:dTDP-4-dehydrorhamnose 3,5-epimerase